jgi:hypothetical protein
VERRGIEDKAKEISPHYMLLFSVLLVLYIKAECIARENGGLVGNAASALLSSGYFQPV